MAYRYNATETFWNKFYGLPNDQKASAREAWKIFKVNPFDPRLGTHKIERLSALAKTTVYSVVIEGDLRAIFQLQGNLVVTMDIGTHKIYQ